MRVHRLRNPGFAKGERGETVDGYSSMDAVGEVFGIGLSDNIVIHAEAELAPHLMRGIYYLPYSSLLSRG